MEPLKTLSLSGFPIIHRTCSQFEKPANQIEEHWQDKVNQYDEEENIEPLAECVHSAGFVLPVDDRFQRCSRREGFVADHQVALEHHCLEGQGPDQNEDGDLQ